MCVNHCSVLSWPDFCGQVTTEVPFLKIDDLSCAYCQLVYEKNVWPFSLSDCPSHACPYDMPMGIGRRLKLAQPSWAIRAKLTQELSVSVPVAV